MWQAPSSPALVLDQCPASAISEESLALVADFLVARQLRRSPRAGGFYGWPALLVDAWLVLAREARIAAGRHNSLERKCQERFPR